MNETDIKLPTGDEIRERYRENTSRSKLYIFLMIGAFALFIIISPFLPEKLSGPYFVVTELILIVLVAAEIIRSHISLLETFVHMLVNHDFLSERTLRIYQRAASMSVRPSIKTAFIYRMAYVYLNRSEFEAALGAADTIDRSTDIGALRYYDLMTDIYERSGDRESVKALYSEALPLIRQHLHSPDFLIYNMCAEIIKSELVAEGQYDKALEIDLATSEALSLFTKMDPGINSISQIQFEMASRQIETAWLCCMTGQTNKAAELLNKYGNIASISPLYAARANEVWMMLRQDQ